MTFLALIIAVILLQVWGNPEAARHDNWFRYWCGRVQGSGLSGWPAFTLLIIVPVVGAVLLLDLLRPLLFGLLWIAVAAALLLYSFGRSDFATVIERYCRYCLNGDFEAAWLYLRSELPRIDDSEDVTDSAALHQKVQQALFYEGYQRWFAVIFYFLLLGPAAALAYRLLQMAATTDHAEMARRCLSVADWVPARLLALTFALAGDFVGSRAALAGVAPGSGVAAEDLLQSVGSSALAGSSSAVELPVESFGTAAAEEVREQASLLVRSATCWLLVASLLELLL
jgi:AmpE protein